MAPGVRSANPWTSRASVLAGRATKDLLATYSDERQPAAWLRHQQIFARPDYQELLAPGQEQDPIIDDDAMELGQLYRSRGIVGAGPELLPARRPDEWAGQPGTRAPHLWLRTGGEPISTLDLFHDSWVLLTQDRRWEQAAISARKISRVEMVVTCLEAGSLDPTIFQKAFGVRPGGAVLVRPDGYIAWRSPDLPAHPGEALAKAWAKVSFAVTREPPPA